MSAVDWRPDRAGSRKLVAKPRRALSGKAVGDGEWCKSPC
jgi:hypothetical protein